MGIYTPLVVYSSWKYAPTFSPTHRYSAYMYGTYTLLYYTILYYTIPCICNMYIIQHWSMYIYIFWHYSYLYGYITNTSTSPIRVLQGISFFYAVTLAFMSPHMEIRFLLPCLPYLHLTAGVALRELLLWATSNHHRWYTIYAYYNDFYAYFMPIMIRMPIFVPIILITMPISIRTMLI